MIYMQKEFAILENIGEKQINNILNKKDFRQ